MVGCHHTSTWYPPGHGFICGRCYKRAPKLLRDRRAKLGRKLGATRDPKRRWRLDMLRAAIVGRMIDVLSAAPVDDVMPAAVREELRQLGL